VSTEQLGRVCSLFERLAGSLITHGSNYVVAAYYDKEDADLVGI